MNVKRQQLAVIQSENSFEDFLLSLEDSPVVQNQKENRDIGPWGKDNPRQFEIYCKEFKKSKQLLEKYQKNDSQKEQYIQKLIVQYDESQPKQYNEQTSITQNNSELNDTQLLNDSNQKLSNDINIQSHKSDFSHNPIEYQGLDDKNEQLMIYYQNGPIHSKKQHNQNIPMKIINNRFYYFDYKTENKNGQNNIIQKKDIKSMGNFDQKVVMRCLNIKSIQQKKFTQDNLVDKRSLFQNQNNNYNSKINSSSLSINSIPNKTNSIDISIQMETYDQIQSNQFESMDSKCKSKNLFNRQIHMINQTHNTSPSQRNRDLLNLKQDIFSPLKASNKSINSSRSISFDKDDMPYESTQLQQALKNQSLKFQRIKQLRSRFKSNSNHSSQKILKTNQSDRDFLPKCTYEDISSNKIFQNNDKDLLRLKGQGYDSRTFDQSPISQNDKKNCKKRIISIKQIQSISQFYLQNQKQPHSIAQKQQQIQEYSIRQNFQSQSIRGNENKTFEINKIRIDSTDSSKNHIEDINQNAKSFIEKNRSSSLKINQNEKNQENITLNNSIRQQYFNSESHQNRKVHKFPQLILTSIKNNNHDNVKYISHNQSNDDSKLDEAMTSSNSSRISKNAQSQETLPKLRQNIHQNTSLEKKQINQYDKNRIPNHLTSLKILIEKQQLFKDL